MKRILVPTPIRIVASLTCIFWLSTFYAPANAAPGTSYAARNYQQQRFAFGAKCDKYEYGSQDQKGQEYGQKYFEQSAKSSSSVFYSNYNRVYSENYARGYEYGGYSANPSDYDLRDNDKYQQRGYPQGIELSQKGIYGKSYQGYQDASYGTYSLASHGNDRYQAADNYSQEQ